MSSSRSFRDPVADDLLERIRNLKELLRSEDAAVGGLLSQSSGSRESNGGTPLASPPSSSQQPPRQRHFSPPTRDSPLQKRNSEEALSTSANEKLIEETWHLLTQVTYVRIVVDRLMWQETPKILMDEMKKPKAPRQKSLVLMEYCFPMTSSADGSISSRDLGKRVVVPAKEILSKVVHFNHRRVVLLRMSQPILQLWSQSYFTIKIFCGKKPNAPIAKCSIPLCKLLVLPFSFDADVVLEPTSDHAKCSGKLKVCIQLGSRFQSFTERVEPMRNPTTAISEFAFIDPMKLVAHVPPAVVKPTVITPARSQPTISAPTSTSAPEKPAPKLPRESTAELTSGSSNEQRPPFSTAGVTSAVPVQPQLSTPGSSHAGPRSQEPSSRPRNAERRLDETFSQEPKETPVSSAYRRPYEPATWRSNDNENLDNERAWLRMLMARRSELGSESDTARSNMAEPYVSNISVYGNRAPTTFSSSTGHVPTAFTGYQDKPLGHQQKAASVQTDARFDEQANVARKLDAAAQTSVVAGEKEGSNGRGKVGRRPTVAEKILMNRSSMSFDDSRELLRDDSRDSLPPAHESHRGFWLQLTIHRARNLPLVKESKTGQTLVKPTCFWTYAAESSTCYTPIATESCEPVWEWSHKMYVAPNRKTLVLKLWHRGKEGKDRVLGFVAVLFPIQPPFERVWYDVIDLTRSSTGQVEISFASAVQDEETQPKSMFGMSADPKQPKDVGMVAKDKEPGAQAMDSSSDENGLMDTGVNTTLPMPSAWMGDRRRSSNSSPFISLTTRSFLSQKLRTNLDELSTLTAHLKQSCSALATPPSPQRPQPIDVSQVTLEDAGGTSAGTSAFLEDSAAGADDIFH